jgi:hypothetical protein
MKFTKNGFWVLTFIILLTACTLRLNEDTTRRMLEVILKDDMSVTVEGIDTAAILQNPYYEYREFKGFKEGQYQYLAIVEFYFLREVKQKIVRKYRFDKRYLKWERYYNEYESY